MVSSTSVVLAATRTTLMCADQIGWPRSPAPGSSVTFGRVALPTKKALGAVKLHPKNPRSRYWAKQGLLVKPGTSFELVVPAAWVSRLTIQWGSPGTPTAHLWVTNCRSKRRGRALARVRGRLHGQQAGLRPADREGRQSTTHRAHRCGQGLRRTGPAAEGALAQGAWKPVSSSSEHARRLRHADRAERGAEAAAHPRFLLRLGVPHLEHAEAVGRGAARVAEQALRASRRCPSPCRCRASRSRRRTAPCRRPANSNTIP